MTADMILKYACSLNGKCDKPRQGIKKQRHHFADKGPYSQSYGFSGSHIWMWELDHKESWVLKNWCFWTVVLEKTLQSPLDCKKIKPVNLKEISPEYSLEGLLIKLKLQYFGNLMGRAKSLEKALMLGKTEDKGEEGGRGWDRWMAPPTDGHEFEQALGVGDGQGSLACCSSWGHKESDMTKRLNWTKLSKHYYYKQRFLLGKIS